MHAAQVHRLGIAQTSGRYIRRHPPEQTRLDHVSFGVAQRADLDTWAEHFKTLNVSQSPINDREGYTVLVFRDPDNIQLELISMG